MPVGRYAPSPSGRLHIGNLRTALFAWWAARNDNSRFLLRMEDLDPSCDPAHADTQLADMAELGLEWDEPVLWQSSNTERYRAAIGRLVDAGMTYPCYCTRREIRDAPRAPHVHPEHYPGTCRTLTEEQRRERELERPPAIRLRTNGEQVTIHDAVHGEFTGTVDDVVLQRNDGVPAYNLVAVVDDAETGVEEVVRGDDLLPSTPRQAHLARLLGYSVPSYVHVPLVLGPDHKRLAKRHGAVTLPELLDGGWTIRQVRSWMVSSIGLDPDVDPIKDPKVGLDWTAVQLQPTVLDPTKHMPERQ